MNASASTHGANPDPEDALLAALRSGHDAAFEALVRTYGGRLLATARRMLPTEEDARDAVQDALLSAFRGLGSFDERARLSTWLHRITVNAALMKLRSRRRRPEASLDDLLPRFDERGEWAEPAVTGPPADAALDSATLRTTVRACIARLPEPHRTVLVLRDLEELDTAEVADALGLTTAAVKTRLHRARQALRTLLERELGTSA